MLARVASSLYWAGRYIERSEHLARYLSVQYFSTFDAPVTQQKEVILTSILQMAVAEKMLKKGTTETLQEQDILVEVAFNPENPNSIFSNVQSARENARGVRSVLSTELWEAINRYYHYVKNYSVDFYKTRGLYDFTSNAAQHCSIIHSYVDSTLLHDDGWAFLQLGIHLERAAQVIRILNNKLLDIKVLAIPEESEPLTAYQWTTTLKILESYDMYRRLYGGSIQQKNVLHFLLTHGSLSRSLTFTLNQIQILLRKFTFAADTDANIVFQASKLANSFKFLEYEDIEEDIQGFLVTSLNKIYNLNNLIEKEYFG